MASFGQVSSIGLPCVESCRSMSQSINLCSTSGFLTNCIKRDTPDFCNLLPNFGKLNGSNSCLRLTRNPYAVRCQSMSGDCEKNWKAGFAFSEASKETFSMNYSPTLLDLVMAVEPLEVNSIIKNVSVSSIDAMKRTVSGMLGLLPANQFKVTVETCSESFSRIIVSAIMTGYTLKSAEFRLSLQQSLDAPHYDSPSSGFEARNLDMESFSFNASSAGACSSQSDVDSAGSTPECLGDLSPEAQAYISQLQGRLNSCSKELERCKSKLSDSNFNPASSGEQNEILKYLRSLDSEKVVSLSQPSSPEVQKCVQRVVQKVLRRIQSFESSSSGSASSLQDGGPGRVASVTDSISASRDHVAKTIFWCMVLGHHMRSLEYRLELQRMLGLTL